MSAHELHLVTREGRGQPDAGGEEGDVSETIYKYQLEITDVQNVVMPKDAKILSVQVQLGALCLWAAVETSNKPKSRNIWIYGTGNPALGVMNKRHIGTVQDGPLVWHVFEED